MLILIFFCFLQGFTEFLPVSSQGHLIVFNEKFELVSLTGITLLESTILAHFGSFFAVLFYYMHTIKGFFVSLKLIDRPDIDKNSFLLVNLIIPSIPLLILGYLFGKFFNYESSRIILLIGITSIIFGVLLFVVDNFCLRIKNLNSLNYLSSLIIGFSQCLALIPGVSRSGSIVTAMRYFGFQRKFAVYYSNLLSIPAILSATGYLLITNFDQISTTSIISLYGITILFFSFIFSIAFIYFFVAWTRNFSFLIFAVYRVIFGIGLIFFFYFQF